MRQILCMLALLAAAMTVQAAPAALPRDSVYQLDVPLTDQAGRRTTLGARRGTAQVVVMFYTSCSYICPTIIDTVLDLDRKLAPAERARLGVLLISLDPRRDDPAALLATATQRGLDLARWTLAQPQAADVRARRRRMCAPSPACSACATASWPTASSTTPAPWSCSTLTAESSPAAPRPVAWSTRPSWPACAACWRDPPARPTERHSLRLPTTPNRAALAAKSAP